MNLGIDTSGFLHRVLDAFDIGDLRTDMKMKKLQLGFTLPLAQHSSGLPIGVQLAGRPATEHTLLQLATALEARMPWIDRTPPLHVSRV